jgi:serine protease Do
MQTTKRVTGIALALAGLLLASCASSPSAGKTSVSLAPEVHALVQDAVFEVVVKKPAKDSLTYDKPLDWSSVPYAIRTDDYYSIGTAFAISKTELVTAFHVINLGEASAIYDGYYIRDSKGNVFEVDTVTRASNERDFITFTVKGKTFDKFFDLQKDFTVGSPVYSVGNALGEGIIVRNGLVLGTIPEEESGRWKKLKSSADGNPGNSGGPLITPDGKVVGIVIELKDNILYSLPTAAMLDTPADNLHFRQKLSYGHSLLPSKTITKYYETDVSLPGNYKAIQKTVTSRYQSVYEENMEALFKSAPVYLDGPNNGYFLNSVVDSAFPEVAFVDKDDNQWTLTDFNVDSFKLPDDGAIVRTSFDSFAFLKINLPKTVSLASVIAEPKGVMDLVLKGLSMERTLGGAEKYRILSFGDPSSVGEYRDAVGRLWIEAKWTLEFEDQCLIAFILPAPDGPVVLLTFQPTSRVKIYEWDMKAICDKAQIAYKGKFPEWTSFLAMKKWVPPFLSDIKFQWSEADKRMSVSNAAFSITAGPELLDWTSASALFLAPAHYREGGKLQYGIRKVLVQRDVRGKDFVILYKNMTPDPILGDKAAEAWDDLVKAKAPFDGIPGIDTKEKVGSVGAILSQAVPSEEAIYSVYLTQEGANDQAALLAKLAALKAGIKIQK